METYWLNDFGTTLLFKLRLLSFFISQPLLLHQQQHKTCYRDCKGKNWQLTWSC